MFVIIVCPLFRIAPIHANRRLLLLFFLRNLRAQLWFPVHSLPSTLLQHEREARIQPLIHSRDRSSDPRRSLTIPLSGHSFRSFLIRDGESAPHHRRRSCVGLRHRTDRNRHNRGRGPEKQLRNLYRPE